MSKSQNVTVILLKQLQGHVCLGITAICKAHC